MVLNSSASSGVTGSAYETPPAKGAVSGTAVVVFWLVGTTSGASTRF